MTRFYLAKLLALVLTPLVLSACGGGSDSDSSSNSSPDSTAPTVTLNGLASVYLVVGDTYTELNATATDDVDGDLTSILSITGTVNTSTAGSYPLTYSVTDTAGNTVSVTRTVVVDPLTPLNDTGITWGGNYPSGNNVGCTGETIGEQDCSHGRDADGALVKVGGGLAGFDFTKLDANGNPLANQTQDYATQSWACVKDNHTGLIWEVKTPDTQGTNLHSSNDTFNWYNTNPATNGGAEGFADDDGNICTGYDSLDASTFCNTQDFVARVNASNSGQGLCGATDWRPPNLNELQSIAYLGKENPAIDDNYFPNSGSSFYWSSSPSALSSGFAWGVYFGNGYDNHDYRDDNYRVRLVRVGQ